SDDELRQRLRQSAEDRCEDEEGDCNLEQPPASVDIAQLAVDRRERRRREQISDDDPREVLEAFEIDRHHRQCGDDDRGVECTEQDRKQDTAECPCDMALTDYHRRPRIRRTVPGVLSSMPHEIVLIAGSPSKSTRSASLFRRIIAGTDRVGITASTIEVRELPASDLLGGARDSALLAPALAAVARA